MLFYQKTCDIQFGTYQHLTHEKSPLVPKFDPFKRNSGLKPHMCNPF